MDDIMSMLEKQINILRELEDANNTNPSSRKRPVRVGPSGRMTPVPWSAGSGPAMGEWAYVDPDRAREVQNKCLCLVCGTHRGDDWVYGLLFGQPYDRISSELEQVFNNGSPSPTYGHPECILLAALYCPHLQNQEYPAMSQDYKRLTVEDLKKLAKDSKLRDRLVMGVGNYARQRRTTSTTTK